MSECLWDRAGALAGKRLYRVSGGMFEVLAVRDAGVLAARNGVPWLIPRAQIEGAARLGLTGRALTPAALARQGCDPALAPYIVGILRAVSRCPHDAGHGFPAGAGPGPADHASGGAVVSPHEVAGHQVGQ